MVDLTQKLPTELLAEILGHASVLDVLRFKQVNRIFRDVILASPLIQHRIELLGAGLEYNAAAGISLADSKKYFLQYRSNLSSLRPIEKRTVDNLRSNHDSYSRAGGGVYAIVEDSVQLFSLGSASRRIPYKEWEITLPTTNSISRVYGFCPSADVITFIELLAANSGLRIRIHLRTLSDGGCHPAAQCPTIYYSQRGTSGYYISTSITNSRLVVLMGVSYRECMVIWDWKTGQVLFEPEANHFDTVEFIDDYRLLVLKSSPHALPSIVVMDTRKDAGGIPVQMLFHLSPYFHNFRYPCLLFERGAHKPSPAEDLAPFHHDHTQRIVALVMQQPFGYLLFRVGALLKLIEGREGGEIEWDEWKTHVVIPSINLGDQSGLIDIWVSGCRLFTITSANHSPDVQMGVYDFSMQGCAKYQSGQVDVDLGGVRYLLPIEAKVRLPLEASELLSAYGGNDSVVFFHIPGASTEGGSKRKSDLQIWTF
ncbi:hypothetical protein BDM02DRAFT_1471703 [Thelephora ganbajun]|uniref:Uncharacterized protein n=1 Tax=Thelephora ganbajun TaxID=370292 RepID=A0ACB6Z2S6_THEGA|nr:hypothetical protein BDM02DRAFT_1471703 [Thelephora ganbajun]